MYYFSYLRFQQNAQPGMVVPGTKLALLTVVTVEAMMGIARIEKGVAGLASRNGATFLMCLPQFPLL